MTDDLTERLRRGVAWNTQGPGVNHDATDELMDAAADELDRLRAALENIVNAKGTTPEALAQGQKDIAREALSDE